jgi:nitrate reductase gamma subunit
VEPSRVVYWNIPVSWKLAFFIFATLAFLIFLLGIWSRMSLWAQGKDEENALKGLGVFGLLWLSFKTFFSRDCILARKLFARSAFRGVMLLFIVWSFLVLFIGTILVTLEHYFDLKIFLTGRVYLIFSLVLDIAGGLLIIGITAALVRRYTTSLDRRISSPEDIIFLLLLLVVVVLGFAVEGLRMAIHASPAVNWSPVGGVFAALFNTFLPRDSLLMAHKTAWIAHGVVAMVFVAYIPYSKIFHLFASQITTSLASSRYGGVVYEGR